MAEPQAHTQTDQARGKETPGQGPTAQGEPRSFDQGQQGRSARSGSDGGQITQAADAARQMADTSRAMGQTAAQAWRRSFDPFLSMQFDLNRWFDDLWRQTIGFSPASASPMLRPFGQMGAANLMGLPPADLQETDSAHLLAVELPGLTRDDVEISVDGDLLTICGHKAEETENASATYRVNERRYGRFERSFPLPPDVDRSRIDAQFRDGVLKITLPKDPRAAPRRAKIEIKG